jgi:hypothetical protein
MYRYHVVPLELSAKEQASPAMIAARVQGLLDHYAKQGWEFMHLESVPGCAGAVGRRAVGGLGGGKGKGGRENGFGRTGTVRTTFWPGLKGSARVRLVAASFRRSQTDATFAPASDGRRPTLHLPRLPTVADRRYICPGFRRSQTDATFAPAFDGRRPTLHFDYSTAAPWGL